MSLSKVTKKVVKAKDGKLKKIRPRCCFCGRFLRKDGRCVKVFYDDWNGGWDHS